MTMIYWVFGNDETRQAVVLANPSFQKIESLKQQGFKLLWDSAPSREKGFQYAAEHGDGSGEPHYYEHDCRSCGAYRPCSLFRGQKWSDRHERWIVFSGHLCDMCCQENDVRVREVKHARV